VSPRLRLPGADDILLIADERRISDHCIYFRQQRTEVRGSGHAEEVVGEEVRVEPLRFQQPHGGFQRFFASTPKICRCRSSSLAPICLGAGPSRKTASPQVGSRTRA
jgi:hypothetical protein